MLNLLRPALALTLLMTLLTGIIYPLAITGIAQIAMPAQANGSLVSKDGAVIGSSLIGQNFATERYFWPRPSATGDAPYNAAGSSGSNLGPTSQTLKDRVAADIERLRDSGIAAAIPGDAATASGSGLDPHISPEYAILQIPRIAAARQLAAGEVARLVDEVTQTRLLGIVGEPRVNVLELNLALDALKS